MERVLGGRITSHLTTIASKGQFWSKEAHMKYTHTNFQLPTSKTVILLMNVILGQFYPLGPSPQGSWGVEGYFPEYTFYEGHTYQFSASQLQNCDLTRNGGDSNL